MRINAERHDTDTVVRHSKDGYDIVRGIRRIANDAVRRHEDSSMGGPGVKQRPSRHRPRKKERHEIMDGDHQGWSSSSQRAARRGTVKNVGLSSDRSSSEDGRIPCEIEMCGEKFFPNSAPFVGAVTELND